MFACYRRFSTTGPRRSLSSSVRRLGIPYIYTYGAISLVELPILFAVVHYTGIDWIQDLELRLRSKIGASTAIEDSWIHKANENEGGKLIAELASVVALHKLLIVARLPLAGALAPVTSRALAQSSKNWANSYTKAQKGAHSISAGAPSAPHPGIHSQKDPMGRFGTPPNKRNKWFSWFF